MSGTNNHILNKNYIKSGGNNHQNSGTFNHAFQLNVLSPEQQPIQQSYYPNNQYDRTLDDTSNPFVQGNSQSSINYNNSALNESQLINNNGSMVYNNSGQKFYQHAKGNQRNSFVQRDSIVESTEENNVLNFDIGEKHPNYTKPSQSYSTNPYTARRESKFAPGAYDSEDSYNNFQSGGGLVIPGGVEKFDMASGLKTSSYPQNANLVPSYPMDSTRRSSRELQPKSNSIEEIQIEPSLLKTKRQSFNVNNPRDRHRLSMMVSPIDVITDKQPVETYIKQKSGFMGELNAQAKQAMRAIWKQTNLKLDGMVLEGTANLHDNQFPDGFVLPLVLEKNQLIQLEIIKNSLLLKTIRLLHEGLQSKTQILIIIRVIMIIYFLAMIPLRIVSINDYANDDQQKGMRDVYFFFQFLHITVILFNFYYQYTGIQKCLKQYFKLCIILSTAEVICNIATFGSGVIITSNGVAFALNIISLLLLFIVNFIVLNIQSDILEKILKILNLLKASENHQPEFQ